MTTSTADNEIVDLEMRYWQAMKEKDADAADKLTDYPCLICGAQGSTAIPDGRVYAGMLSEGSWSIEGFKISQPVVRRLSDTIAIIAYKVTESLTVEGKPITLEASDSSIWVHREGGWKCAMHTEAIAGDPYGRDRKLAD